jgi:hypothetical protein
LKSHERGYQENDPGLHRGYDHVGRRVTYHEFRRGHWCYRQSF